MQSIITDSTITLIAETGPSVIGKSHPNFYKIKKALLQKNFLEVEELLDVKNGYKEFSNGLIAVDGDNLIYNGTIVHNVLTQRIVEMIHNGDEANPMLNFLVNLMDNPSEGSIDQLYTFLEHENLPITEDGCFLAYKAIKRDYTDKYTGTISNKVGEKVKMPYEEVTADPTLHCSSGLHCGSIDYVRCYGNFSQDEDGNLNGDRLVTVKVNPSDVVSVPEDSDRQKVRVYRYVVHEEIENPYDLVPKYEAPVYYDDEGNVYDEDYDDYESYDDEYSWDTHGECEDDEDEPGNPVEGLIDFDDPQRSESIIAGMLRQSTDNPLKKNSVDSDESEMDMEMVNAMYNGVYGYDKKQPSEKNSFDSRFDMHQSAREIFEYYENKYGMNVTDSVTIDSMIGDLKDAGFDMTGQPLKDSPNQKNFLDEMFQDASCYAKKDTEKNSVDSDESVKSELPSPPSEIILDSDEDSNEESVVKVEKPNNIILPNNN